MSWASRWVSRATDAGLANRRLGVAAVGSGIQALLMVWIVAGPDTVPESVRLLVLGLSVVVATAIGLDAKKLRSNAAVWWKPLRPAWALGGAIVGANVGILLAYCLRRIESHEQHAATGRWYRPTVATALIAGLGTGLFQGVFLPNPGVVGSLLLLLTGNAIGFALVAMYYDTRFVTGMLDETGHGWLFRGYHWLVLGVLLIPTNVVFLGLYVWRRRTLVARAQQSQAGFGDLGSPDLDRPEDSGK